MEKDVLHGYKIRHGITRYDLLQLEHVAKLTHGKVATFWADDESIMTTHILFGNTDDAFHFRFNLYKKLPWLYQLLETL